MKIPELPPGRYFLALWPSAGVRDAIANTAANWLSASSRCRRVAPERYHLTLQFLGDLDAVGVRRLAGVVDTLTSLPLPAFRLCLDQFGHFGHRVGWLGPGQPPGELISLQQAISQCVQQAGVAPLPDTVFTPHVTLARDHRGSWPAVRAGTTQPVEWFVQAWTLVHSLPAPAQGYRIVARHALQAR